MRFLKRKHLIRRYSPQTYTDGYASVPYEDSIFLMDVQTMEDIVETTPDGTVSRQRVKTFCDSPILVEDQEKERKADRLWFQEKWFECRSSRLSENTPLRHYTSTFVQCLDQDPPPEDGGVYESD